MIDRLAGARVLVVEDEPDTRDLLCMILDDVGAIVEAASDGEQALAICERFAPDLVVSDLSLPIVDGWHLLDILRRRGLTAPALALSASASLEDAARALRAGFDAHVAKPIGSEDFLDALLSIVDLQRAPLDVSTRANTPVPRGSLPPSPP